MLRFIGHHLPAVPHASAVVNRLLKPWYLRKPRGTLICDVLGRLMELDPSEAVDANLIFCPQLYDRAEIAFLLSHLSDHDTFVDVGAHKGFYALMATRRISRGSILAVEAEPETCACLKRNVDLNAARIRVVNNGVSDREETLFLNVQTAGNRSGSSFLGNSATRVPVHCVPLLSLVQEAGIERITCMKLDIEGFEHKALAHFFGHADRAVHPSYVITEYHPDPRLHSGDLPALLNRLRYQEIVRTPLNRIFARPA